MTSKPGFSTPEEVRALLVRLPQPTRGTLALVAGAPVQPNREGRGRTSSTAKWWLKNGMPTATFQLVDTKLLLWERKIATWEEITTTPLKDLLVQKWPRARGPAPTAET